MRSLATLCFAAALLGAGAQTAGASTLDQVKARGTLICGTNPGLAGFALPDSQGVYKGLDIDECRALAAAIFNDPGKVKYLPINAKDRPTILASGQIDVLIRNTTWTLSRETGGMFFTGINYYDGQGFMVKKKLGVASALKLDGASICVQQGTTTELNLADYFRAHNMKFEPVVFATDEETVKAYDSGRCDAYTTDASGLYAERLKLGVTQANVDAKLKSDNPAIRRLLGVEGDLGKGLGLTNDWAYRIIKAVGNYGESFERNVGMGSPLKLERGVNALWTKGGLMYPLPLR